MARLTREGARGFGNRADTCGGQRLPRAEGNAERSHFIQTPFLAKALAGLVVDPAGFQMPGVVVKPASRGWKASFEDTVTDSEGKFSLPAVRPGKYFLELRRPGFDTLRVRVIVSKKSREGLKLVLSLST